SFYLHSPPRHENGKQKGRNRNPSAHSTPMAIVDEVLEIEPATRPIQLVKPFGLANWFDRDVALQTAQDQRTQFHLAALNVFRRHLREKPRADGKDLPRPTSEYQDSQRSHRQSSSTLPTVFENRQR